MLVSAGHRSETWATVQQIEAVPERVDIEIPLRRTYAGKPYVSEQVEVTAQKQSLKTATTDYYTLTFPQIWWQAKGTTAWSSVGAGMSLRNPSVCVEWSMKATEEPPDPVVDRRLEAITADGRSLTAGGGVGTAQVWLSRFDSERPQAVRLKWTPIHARDTGKRFVFAGIAPEKLILKGGK